MQNGSRHFAGLEIGLNHTVPMVVANAAARFGKKPYCISESGVVTTFADLSARVEGFGADLLRRGVRFGDRIVVLAPNSVEWIIAALGAMSIGAIMVPINTRFKGPEVRHVLETSRAAVVCTVGSFLGVDYPAMIAAACGGVGQGRPAAELPYLRAIVEIDAPGFAPVLNSREDRGTFAQAVALVTPETTADILFTSGTTGKPKGAMHGHGQGLWMAGLWNEANDLTDADRAAIVNPFFHSFGYRSGWVSALAAGMTIYPMAAFDAGALLRLIERERITQLSGAPAVFFSMLQHPEFGDRDISSLRSGHTGGAKTPPEIIKAGYDELGFEIFLTSFGQTEATAMISTNRPGDPLEAILKTVGRPIPLQEIRIVDGTGADVPIGESGELLVRGPNVMQGYFEDAEQTAKTIDAEGWLHTGDVAALDGDGRLRILDRIKDIVIVGGFNAYPVEIEIALGEHPAIVQVAVIGLPDARMGEVVAACVVLQPGRSLTISELTEWARERMANFKVPRHLMIYDSLPMTSLGKVQKAELRQGVMLHLNQA